jgi:AraC-like DNA-binding protein
MDVSDRQSNEYLKINSCGIQKIKTDHTVIRENGRSDFHLLVILSGECRATVGGNEFTLSAGNYLVYFPHEPQKYSFKCGDVSFWCHFTGSAAGEILSKCEITSGIGRTGALPEVSSAIAKLLNAYASKRSSVLVEAYLSELLHFVSEKAEFSGCSASDCVSKVLDFIHLYYTSDITLDKIAKKCGYSKSYISHEFVLSIGTSPMKYLCNYRLRAALELIDSTELPISEIALSCGFNDPLYFCRAFKNHYGLSPTARRKKI